MIKLYIRDVSPLFGGAWREKLPQLPPERREQAERLRRDEDAARSVGAWLLLGEALTREGLDIDALKLQKNDFGKPYFVGGPEFSISHADQYAAVALSSDPVGVDIEGARCTLRIAKHFFAAAEVEAAEALSGVSQALFLQRLWVAKEAFVKALGTGLTTPLDAFCVHLNGDTVTLSQELTPLPFRIADFPMGGHRVAVAGLGDEITVQK